MPALTTASWSSDSPNQSHRARMAAVAVVGAAAKVVKAKAAEAKAEGVKAKVAKEKARAREVHPILVGSAKRA